VPIAFYEAAFREFERLAATGIQISHSFQTNGTLIDHRWIEFLREHPVNFGVSVDGPKHIPDMHRQFRSGRGSWNKCMEGIRLLQEAKIPFHTITVLTEPALRDPEGVFEFFETNGLFDVGFNIEEIESENTRSSLADIDYTGLYRQFFRRFLELNALAGFPLRIREAEVVAAAMLRGEIPYNTQNEPGSIISIDVDGNASPFSPELLGMKSVRFSDFIIGSFWHNTVDEMLESPTARMIADEISLGVENCRRSCEYFAFCKGGAPVNKLCEKGSFQATSTMHCELTIKTTYSVCLDTLLQAKQLTKDSANDHATGGRRPD